MITKTVICNDGTQEEVCIKDCPQTLVAVPPPCENNGGVKEDAPVSQPPVEQKKPLFTETQKKWFAVIGLTALTYYILYKAGSFSNE